jgi:hypothetical protein
MGRANILHFPTQCLGKKKSCLTSKIKKTSLGNRQSQAPMGRGWAAGAEG